MQTKQKGNPNTEPDLKRSAIIKQIKLVKGASSPYLALKMV